MPTFNPSIAFIIEIAEHVRAMRVGALRKLGVTRALLSALRPLTVIELVALGQLPLPIKHGDELAQQIRLVRAGERKQALIYDLVAADASRAMMRRFFGLSPQDYCELRVFFGLMVQRGPAPKPTPKDHDCVNQALLASAWCAEDALACPEKMLFLSQQTTLTVRAIHRILEDPYDVTRRAPSQRSSKARA